MRKLKLLVGIFLAVLLAGCQAGGTVFPESSKTPRDERREWIAALQPEGYEDLTVAEFQEQLLPLMDTAAAHTVEQDLMLDGEFSAARDTDPLAAYYYCVVEPLTAEQWQRREFSGGASSGSGMAEYVLTLAITDPHSLTVGQYEEARRQAEQLVEEFLADGSDELVREAEAGRALQQLAEEFCQSVSSGGLAAEMEVSYRSRDAGDGFQAAAESAAIGDPRTCAPSTPEDYASLLALMTPGWEHLSLREFNARLLDWADSSPASAERIDADCASGDVPEALEEVQARFATWTVRLSSAENGQKVRSGYTGQPERPVVLPVPLAEKRAPSAGRPAAWADLQCSLQYEVLDPDSLCVQERDQMVADAVQAVQDAWESLPLEAVLCMEGGALPARLNAAISSCGSKMLCIGIETDTLHLDRADERSRYSEVQAEWDVQEV